MDLLPLRPVGKTLRLFVYKMDGFDLDTLDTISDVFPHLTTLGLIIHRTTQDFQWKVCILLFLFLCSLLISLSQNSYDDVIAKNTKLQYLTVSARDFIFCNWNPQMPHTDCKRCGNQRVDATRTLALACTGLKCCRWEHVHAQYCFNIRLSRKSSDANTLVRVKRVPVTDRYEPFPSRRWWA
jgi:hypothetical protein